MPGPDRNNRMNSITESASVLTLLPKEERDTLRQRSVEKSYPKGSVLFHAEDRADFVWLVKTGRIHLTHYSSSGRVFTNCVAVPGEIFCCLSSLDRRAYPAEAVAGLDSIVAKIPLDLFSGWMQKYPAFSHKTICFFCDRLRAAEQKGCLLQEPVRERILGVLWTLAVKFGSTIPFTCREVAEMAGTTVETTIRTFALLKEEKLIRATRAKITICDPSRLRKLLGKSTCT